MDSGDTEPTLSDPAGAGSQALARGAWRDARACFEAALRRGETPEALEGLGLAAWWLDDAAATLDARQRAYRLYRQRGDYRGAARVATQLAFDYYSFRGEYAVANGWSQRAHHLLEGLDPAAEHGWLAIWDAHVALQLQHDTATAQRRAAQAAALGRALNLIDLEMLALALEGLALVSAGAVAEGMRRLDESTTAAVAGEMTDLDSSVTACCYLIYACEQVRDYARAAQWCEKVKEVTARGAYPLMFSLCRTHYAGVLVWRGTWAEAEATLLAATDQLLATRPAQAAEGIVRLADLRRRQGRYDEAAALLTRAESHTLKMIGGNLALLGRAALALDRGDAATAADLAERFLRGLPDANRLERPAALELLALAQVARGALDLALNTCRELRAIASAVATEPLRAAAAFIEGAVAAAQGDHETARRRFEDALDLYERTGAAFEAARTRIELARSLLALGRIQAAEALTRQAWQALHRLGAGPEAARATGLLREISAAPAGPGRQPPATAALTPREVEVLRLIAAGKSNQEIAAGLVLSVRTVERHISNIYAKIDAGGPTARAAAIAYALRHGL